MYVCQDRTDTISKTLRRRFTAAIEGCLLQRRVEQVDSLKRIGVLGGIGSIAPTIGGVWWERSAAGAALSLSRPSPLHILSL